MPYSYSFFKPEIRQWFIDNVPTSKRILDVGPGQGTYSDLLRDLGYQIDAVEVWAPYVDQFNLRAKYDNVYIQDIREFDLWNYDFVILGDVLEHLPEEDAKVLITKIAVYGMQCLVAVPYMMAQDGEEYGNVYETHHQADLTPEVMIDRYPGLKPIYKNQWYGYYISDGKFMHDKVYVLYATESYKDTVQACVHSINAVSDIPVYVFMLNSNVQIDGAYTINWICDTIDVPQDKYIDRSNPEIYKILIQRPAIIKNALKFAKTVAYIDSDTVVTKYIDSIFNYFPERNEYPYFVEGIYDWMHVNGRGGAESRDDLSTTLEHPACKLFDVDQSIRDKYRQTGYFVAGQWCEKFLDEWWWMCNHPTVVKNPQYYAPYHEETIANVLLWKWKALRGLPYLYINGSLDLIGKVKFYGQKKHVDHFVAIPAKESELLFYHGEKDPLTMYRMIERQRKRLKVLFLAPHLSTGGMPAFLLKRIQSLQDMNIEIHVVEYANHSDHYVVQKNQIKQLVDNFYTLGENKLEIVNIIKNNSIDIVHIEEMIEDGHNNWPEEFRQAIYDDNRTWRVIETCHNIVFKPDIEKRHHPDAYAFCTPHHMKTFANMPSPKYVIEYPIEKRDAVAFDFGEGYHVLNVGLWTPGKNQKEAVELAKQMPDVQFHFVGNQAGNFQHYWEPIMKDIPSNVHVWGERNDVDSFMKGCDVFLFNSVFECNPLVLREAIGHGIPIIARNLSQYEDMFTDYIIDLDPLYLKEQVYEALKNPVKYTIPEDSIQDFALSHLHLYTDVVNKPIQSNENVIINHYFVLEPFLEIKGNSKSKFEVRYYDEKGVCHFDSVIGVQNWVKLNRRWYTKWHIQIWKDDEPYYEYTLDYTGKRVYISFDSKSLGDTIAWLPYALEFKKKHNCHVIVSTHKNFLFKDVYPELEFINPGERAHNVDGMYMIGWFYDQDKEPVLPNTIPLQQAATNILGLEYKEIKPRISYKVGDNLYGKYVTIATNSTAGCKFWTKEGWQEVINYLVENGYKVVNVSKEKNPFNNCIQIEDASMENTMNVIHHSEFFIGLSSGLSWLAWAMDKQVVMISNFTDDRHEFNCIRVTNKSVCHACWNSPDYQFDKGDWNWCPINKNTPKHFECHRSISGEDVIKKINSLIHT